MFFLVDTTGNDGPSLTGPFATYDEAWQWVQRVRPEAAERWDSDPDLWIVGADEPAHTEQQFATGAWVR